MLHAIVTANQECSFWEINQSECKNVIDNACSFFVPWSWSRSEITIFFGAEYCGKKQIERGSALSVYFYCRIDNDINFVDLLGCASWIHNGLTTVRRILLSIRVQTMLNHVRFVEYKSFSCHNYKHPKQITLFFNMAAQREISKTSKGFIKFPNTRKLWNHEAAGRVVLLFSSAWKPDETRSTSF